MTITMGADTGNTIILGPAVAGADLAGEAGANPRKGVAAVGGGSSMAASFAWCC
jgi:hypothetical protein